MNAFQAPVAPMPQTLPLCCRRSGVPHVGAHLGFAHTFRRDPPAILKAGAELLHRPTWLKDSTKEVLACASYGRIPPSRQQSGRLHATTSRYIRHYVETLTVHELHQQHVAFAIDVGDPRNGLLVCICERMVYRHGAILLIVRM